MSLWGQSPTIFDTKNGLITNHVYEINQDNKGYLWLGTNRGLIKYDGKNFKQYTHKNGLPNNAIWKLELDNKGRMWFFCKSNRQGYIYNDSIYTFKTEDNKVITPNDVFFYNDKVSLNYQDYIFTDKILKKRNPSPNYFKTNLQSQEIIGHGIYIKILADRFEVRDTHNNELVQSYVSNWGKDDLKQIHSKIIKDQFFIARSTKKVAIYDYKNDIFNFYDLRKYGFKNNQHILVRHINDEFQISGRNRLIILNNKYELVQEYSFPEHYETISGFKDNDGNIWVNSHKNGLFFFSKQKLRSKFYLEGQKIYATKSIEDDFIAINSYGNVYNFDGKINDFVINPSLAEKQQNAVTNIIQSNDKTYILKDRSSYLYDGLNSKRTNKIDSFYIAGGKNLIFHNDDIYLIRSSTTKNLSNGVNTQISGLRGSALIDNRLIMNSASGIFEIIPDSIFQIQTNNANFNSNPTTNIRYYKNKTLISTEDYGLFTFKDDKVTLIKGTDTEQILSFDIKDNKLWLNTYDGIKVFSINDSVTEAFPLHKFNQNDGLLEKNANSFSFHDNKIWISHDNGISVIESNLDLYKRDLKITINTPDTIQISKNSPRNINIDINAIDFIYQNDYEYYYKESRSNNEWIKLNNNKLSLRNLSPGNHDIIIKVQDQHSNYAEKIVHISVEKKWFEKRIVLITLSLLGLMLLAYTSMTIAKRVYIKKIKKQAQERAMNSIQLQALRAQMNPHFVHNSLNSILYYIQNNDLKTSELYLTKFSDLIRLFFEYSRLEEIHLHKEIHLLKTYIEIEQLRFEDKISYEIFIDKTLNVNKAKIPTLILQSIVENSIKHGIFHKPTKGKISIKFNALNNDDYQVIIEDDGIGINKSKELYSNSKRQYKSKSGAVLVDRLQLLKNTNEWNIDYQIIDLETIGKQGTRVTISFHKQTNSQKN